MKTQKEGVTCIFTKEQELVAIIHKDTKSHNNVFYACNKMSMTELETLVGSDTVKA